MQFEAVQTGHKSVLGVLAENAQFFVVKVDPNAKLT